MDNELYFLKVVYFDEESATDLLCMKNKGKVVNEIKKGSKLKDLEALQAEIGGGIKLPSWPFSIFANANAKGTISHSAEKIVNQIFTNDILSDYLSMANDIKVIKKFNNSLVYAYPNSLAYFKLITPYMGMTEGKMDAGEFKLNIQMMDDALTRGKGYYEMLLEKEGEKVVLRFNLNSFRNAYSLADLVKMNLCYHGVKVGKININNLDIENEFKFEEKIVDAYDLATDDVNVVESSSVDVYDILFAGVSYED